MQVCKARLHVKTTVPPGDSLVGLFPYNVFRPESVKLSPSEHLQLVTVNHNAVPFDGSIYDLRARVGGTTLGIGNHLSLFVRNLSSAPEPLELQILGSTVDEYLAPEPQAFAPELGHRVVLGLFAQEQVAKEMEPGDLPLADLLSSATNNLASARRELNVAFERACIHGTPSDLRLHEQAQDHVLRLERIVSTVQGWADDAAREREPGLAISDVAFTQPEAS